MKYQATAKINLFLRVRGKRPDGYHELDTLFQEIDLADTFELVDPAGPFRLEVEGADLGPLDENLVVKAARLLQQTIDRPISGYFILKKGIPAGAGLGGGSSDAAKALVVLAEMVDAGLTQADLAALALQLGADVPFFLYGGSMRGRGVGEKLEPFALPAGVPRGGFLFMPGIHIDTVAVFRGLQGRFGGSEEPQIGENDLLVAAREVSPAFAQVYDRLKALFVDEPYFFMTGSGSTMVLLSEAAQLPEAVTHSCSELGVAVEPFRFVMS